MGKSNNLLLPHYSIPIHDHLITVRNPQIIRELPGNVIYFGNTNKSVQGLYDSPEFIRFTNDIRRHGKPVSVLFGKTDSDWLPKHEDLLPSNVIRIFANNVTFPSERSRPFPMGRDFRLAASTYLQKYYQLPVQKDTACYANFSNNTHRSRKDLEAACRLNPTIHSKHLGSEFLNYKVSYEEFFLQLSRSKFCICPRGNGFDSFRFWDSLYLGAIPIITDDALIKNMNITVPYVVMTPEEIETTDFNQLTYEWHSEYDMALKLSHWLSRAASEGHQELHALGRYRHRKEWHSVDLNRKPMIAMLRSRLMSLLSKIKHRLEDALRA